jgi:hypothetical protein
MNVAKTHWPCGLFKKIVRDQSDARQRIIDLHQQFTNSTIEPLGDTDANSFACSLSSENRKDKIQFDLQFRDNKAKILITGANFRHREMVY